MDNEEINRLNETIKDFLDLDKELINKEELQVIGTVVQSTVCCLTSLANSIDGQNRQVRFQNIQDWKNTVTNLNRFFYSHIHIATELGLSIYCERKQLEIKPSIYKQKIKEYENKIQDKIAPEHQQLVRKFIEGTIYDKPTFGDYLEPALSTAKFDDKEKEFFRIFFDALSVLRNKASHSNVKLTDKDKKKLTDAKLDFFISEGGEPQADPRIQPHMTKIVKIFFEHLE